MTKSRLTPEQRFKQLFNLYLDESTTPGEREAAERKWRERLRRHGKKPSDISAILAQAEYDDAAARHLRRQLRRHRTHLKIRPSIPPL